MATRKGFEPLSDSVIIDGNRIKLKNKLTNIKPELSPIQLEAIKNPCPHCLTGVLYAVSGEGEQLLYCNHCLLSMDSDGGMIS